MNNKMAEMRIDALKNVDKRLMFSVMDLEVTERYLTTAYWEKQTSWLDGGMIEMRERMAQAERILKEVKISAHDRLCDMCKVNVYRPEDQARRLEARKSLEILHSCHKTGLSDASP